MEHYERNNISIFTGYFYKRNRNYRNTCGCLRELEIAVKTIALRAGSRFHCDLSFLQTSTRVSTDAQKIFSISYM